MTTLPASDQSRNARLLSVAIQLRRSHGILYAMRFLEEYDFDQCVIWEVLGLIPAQQSLLSEGDSLTSQLQYPTEPQ